MFEKELRKYNLIKKELVKRYPDGGYVVIKGNEVLGVWEDRMDAIKKGLEKYGNVRFLVKNINEKNAEINFSMDIKFA